MRDTSQLCTDDDTVGSVTQSKQPQLRPWPNLHQITPCQQVPCAKQQVNPGTKSAADGITRRTGRALQAPRAWARCGCPTTYTGHRQQLNNSCSRTVPHILLVVSNPKHCSRIPNREPEIHIMTASIGLTLQQHQYSPQSTPAAGQSHQCTTPCGVTGSDSPLTCTLHMKLTYRLQQLQQLPHGLTQATIGCTCKPFLNKHLLFTINHICGIATS